MKTWFAFLLGAMVALPVVAEAVEKLPTPVSLKAGQQISILLDGNAGTGYSWQLAEPLPAGGPVQVSLSGISQNDDTNCCGFPVPTTLTIAGVKPGKALVRVVYVRPWEKDKKPAAEECFSVKVQRPSK